MRLASLAFACFFGMAFASSRCVAQNCGDWSFAPVGTPPPQYFHAMAFDSDRNTTLLVTGLYAIDTWTWNGSNWTQVAAAPNAPTVSSPGAMSYDTQRHRMVMVGAGETWEWDGARWDRRSAFGPSNRYGFGLAYDSVRHVTVLFGGAGGAGDTWHWNGVFWQQVANTGPGSRFGVAMAFDSRRGVTVLFGGYAQSSGGPVGDTWEWDGTAWRQVATIGPRARFYSPGTYDIARGEFVIVGGDATSPSGGNDVWGWDGSRWAYRFQPGFPGAINHQLAFDSVRQRLVVLAPSFSDSGVWELSSPQPPSITVQPQSSPAALGESFSVSVAANSPQSLTYRWRLNGARLVDGGVITGSQTTTLSIRSLSLSLAGIYDCEVSNSCGTIVSSPAIPMLLPVECPGDFNGDGGIDGTDVQDFFAHWEGGC